MKTIQKILPITAIAILLILIIVGFFYIGEEKTNSRHLLIPSNANGVAYLKPEKITNEFYKLLKRDPTLLDSVSSTKIDFNEIQKNNDSPGINPLVDLIIYTYYDLVTHNENVGIIIDVIDENQFLNSLSETPETYQSNNFSTGQIITIKKEKMYVLNNEGNTYVVLQPIDKKGKVTIEEAQSQFNLIFGEAHLPLAETNSSFKQFTETEKQFGIWTSSESELINNLSEMFSIFGNFGEKAISFNAEQEEIAMQVVIDLKSTDFYVENNQEQLTLNKGELAKFSLSTTSKYLNNILEKVFSRKQRYILNYCTGSLSGGVIGYKETPVFTTKMEQVIDPETFETVEKMTKVEASPRLNIPELMYVLKIEKPTELFALLNTDSLITNEAGYWTIPHPLFMDELIYLTLKNDLLYIGTNQQFEKFSPQFNTFGFIANIPKAIETYPPKNSIQKLGMLAIPEIKFKTIELNFDKIEGDQLYLKGAIKMTDKTQHTMLILSSEMLKFRGLLKGFI